MWKFSWGLELASDRGAALWRQLACAQGGLGKIAVTYNKAKSLQWRSRLTLVPYQRVKDAGLLFVTYLSWDFSLCMLETCTLPYQTKPFDDRDHNGDIFLILAPHVGPVRQKRCSLFPGPNLFDLLH